MNHNHHENKVHLRVSVSILKGCENKPKNPKTLVTSNNNDSFAYKSYYYRKTFVAANRLLYEESSKLYGDVRDLQVWRQRCGLI